MQYGVVVNTRILASPITGVQRYTLELLNRFGDKVERVEPSHNLDGVQGHCWEQTVLPIKLKGRLLWSPSNTGPLVVEHQVVTIHDMVSLDHPEWLNPRFVAWYRFLIPRLVHRARYIVAISEFTKSRLIEVTKTPEDKIVVIPNGVDPHFSPKSPTEAEASRASLGIPARHYILSLGTLEPRKNLHRLLQAWLAIHDKIPSDVWLVLAGGKGKRLVFQELNIECLPPRVYMTGHVPDEHLPALYSGALAFAYLSVYEGFGLPPLEAMAAGVPVLTGNRTALPEVVADAGVIVDPYDVDAIADAMVTLVEKASKREELRQKGLERAKLFSWDQNAKKMWDVLSGAMAND